MASTNDDREAAVERVQISTAIDECDREATQSGAEIGGRYAVEVIGRKENLGKTVLSRPARKAEDASRKAPTKAYQPSVKERHAS